MSFANAPAVEVFSIRDIAQAAGVRARDVRGLVESGAVSTIDGHFARPDDAVLAVRLLRGSLTPGAERGLFGPAARTYRSPGGLAASGAIHAALFLGLILLSAANLSEPVQRTVKADVLPLIFVPIPGPSGGGGGGGLQQPAPPPKAELRGPSVMRSPVPPPRRLTSRPPEPKPVVRVEPPAPTPRPVDPPPPAKPEVTPQVVAPVATAPADPVDRAGVVAQAPAPAAVPSQGPGTGGGAGTGQGTGLGEGSGSGIGPGTGGGTGGGPYRPGSGITPPGLLREVKPDYTEEARRRGISGDVVLEIVVRSDGTVGNIKVLQGLGAGLDQRAVDAVRGWRFSPAKRYGTPVDVLVEVAVEFKLR